MSTPYQRGHAFELRVKKELEAEGWLVCRSPASKSPFDLMALIWSGADAGYTRAVLVQCKLRGSITKAEINELTDVAEAYGCEAVVAHMLPEGKLIHYYLALYGPKAGWTP